MQETPEYAGGEVSEPFPISLVGGRYMLYDVNGTKQKNKTQDSILLNAHNTLLPRSLIFLYSVQPFYGTDHAIGHENAFTH